MMIPRQMPAVTELALTNKDSFAPSSSFGMELMMRLIEDCAVRNGSTMRTGNSLNNSKSGVIGLLPYSPNHFLKMAS
mgnify:CR=1 FL=1